MRNDWFLTNRAPGTSVPASSASLMAFLSGAGGGGSGWRWNLPHVLDLDGGRVGANRNVEIRTFHLLKPRVLISVESSPLWRSKYSRKKPPLNHVFTLAILIHSRGGDEEMYIVETLAKNRRLYPGEGKGC